MHGLSAGVTQSWFVAKAAVVLVPIVIFGAADVIGWFLRRTIWAETEKDFYVGSRRDMLHRFDGDRKIARRRMLPDRAVLTANNPQCLLLNFAFGRGSNDRH